MSESRALRPGENLVVGAGDDPLECHVTLSPVARDTGATRPDISALLVGPDGSVRDNADFVFYNQTASNDGAIRMVVAADDETDLATLTLELHRVDPTVDRIILAASVDVESESGSPALDALTMTLSTSPGDDPIAEFLANPGPGITAVVPGEFYRRAEQWKFRAVGQGYAGGLAEFARHHGVEVDADTEAPDETAVDDSTAPPVSEQSAPKSSHTPSASRRLTVARRPARPPRLPEWSISSSLTDDDEWDRARLFSVSGIGKGEERERRSASALLAVMSGVREFGRELTRRCGAIGGTIETFVEPQFTRGDTSIRPDGLVRVRRGGREWTALVEVKTSNALLRADQIEMYVELARTEGFDAVITVSNQLLSGNDDLPVEIDRRKLRKVAVRHVSWDEIRSVAIHLSMHDKVEDATQGWVLREFVRYLLHDQSKLQGFTDMGPDWAHVRDGVKNKTIHPRDKAADGVCRQFDQLIRHIGHDLSCLLGVDVAPVFPRNRADSTPRIQQLTDSGVLFGSLRIPGTVGPLTLSMDLRTDKVSCSTTVDAARTSRAATSIRHLLRQIPDAPDKLLVQASTSRAAARPRQVELTTLRDDPQVLVESEERPPRRFTLTLTSGIGGRGGPARGNVVAATDSLIAEFYRDVVQHLRPPKDSDS